jgi:hypothetical protein
VRRGKKHNAHQAIQNRRSAPDTLPVPPPIPPLPAAFWQGVLFGSPDAMLPSTDATQAARLVAQMLGSATELPEFVESIRAGQLRKLLRERFDPARAEQAMAALWRSAPSSPGTPEPNGDQTNCSPGVRDCPRSMPAWRREFYSEVSNEQRLLEGSGGWCG